MDIIHRNYLAYGSNLCVDQMARRCPAARAKEVIQVPGWRFCINQLGVATLLRDESATIYGLIWSLSAACEEALDRYEGVAEKVYRKEFIVAGTTPVLVYLANEQRPGCPKSGYLEIILRAAARLGMTPAYQAELAAWRGNNEHLRP
jgi:hypothetical protein